jgi:hypothetical protein
LIIYVFTDYFRVIKSSKQRWAGHVTHYDEKFPENFSYKTWTDHSEDLYRDRRIIFKLILNKHGEMVWNGSVTVANACEKGTEYLCSIKQRIP